MNIDNLFSTILNLKDFQYIEFTICYFFYLMTKNNLTLKYLFYPVQ